MNEIGNKTMSLMMVYVYALTGHEVVTRLCLLIKSTLVIIIIIYIFYTHFNTSPFKCALSSKHKMLCLCSCL